MAPSHQEDKSSGRILLVDDDPNLLKSLAFQLGEEGYSVLVASNGEEAIQRIKEEKPALVLLDIMMPGMSGQETLKKIKEIDREIPVAMVTAVWDKEEGKRAFEAGAYDYVTKPIDFEYLKQVIFVKLFSTGGESHDQS